MAPSPATPTNRYRPLRRPVEALRRLADAVEQAPLGPGPWLATFLAIVALRHLLELLSARLPVYRPAAFLVHYPLAYLAPALTLALLLSLLARWPVRRVTRLMLPAAALLLLPPLVDLALPLLACIPGLPDAVREALAPHLDTPATIGYRQDLYEQDGLWTSLLRITDPRQALEGTTLGIRIEALMASLIAAVYVKMRRGTWWRVLLTFPIVLFTAFLFFTLPNRFLDLVRLFRPALSMNSLYGGMGFLPGPEMTRDGVSVFYLAILVLLVLVAWIARDEGLPALRTTMSSLAWGKGFLTGALAVAGMAAGVFTRSGLQEGLTPSVYDQLAMGALVVAAILLGAGLGVERPIRMAPLCAGTLALCLAAGAGYPALAGALVLAGACWARGGGLASISRRPLPGALTGGLAGLAAVAFGYIVFTGEEGLSWIPRNLLLAGFLTGMGVTLAGHNRDVPSTGRVLAGCATAAALLPALAWPLCLAAPAALLTIAVLFFGGASLSVRLLLTAGGPRGLVPGILGAAALASALLTLTHPPVRDDLVREVLSRPAYHLARGDELQEQQAFREAEREYRLALTMDPVGTEPLFRLGGLEVARAGKLDEIRKHPGIQERSAFGADLKEEFNARIRDAAKYFRRALKIDPEHVASRFNLGTALYQLGDLEGAERAFAAVLERAPQHLGALFQSGEVLILLKRPGEAVVYLEAYLEVAGDDPSQAVGRARARELLRVLPQH